MEKLTIINHEINRIPEELENRIKPLLPGQTIKITINPSKKKPVRMQTGREHETNPDTNTKIRKSGAVMLTQHWEIMFNGVPIKCGYVTGLDGQNNPKFAKIFFNPYGEIIINGDNGPDRDFYRLWQLSPNNRWNVINWDEALGAPKQARQWIGQDVDPSKERSDLFNVEQYKFGIMTKVMTTLSDADVCKLMAKDAPYGYVLYAQPYLENDAKSARAFIVERLNKGPGLNGYKEAEQMMSNLEKIIDISTIHAAIVPTGEDVLPKWNVTDNEIRWTKNSALAIEFKKPIGHNDNPSERAKEIYKRFGDDAAFKNCIKELRADHKSVKAKSVA